MAEYIERQAAIDTVAFGITIASAFNNETGERIDLFVKENDELWKAIKRIKALPSADVVQVVHGHWIDVGSLSCRCDQCGCKSNKETRFCPNCGSKMDAQGEE